MTSIMSGFLEAVTILTNWNILIETDETGKAVERFIGVDKCDGQRHLSEKISHFDKNAKLALIETGQLYILHGEASLPDDKTIDILGHRIGFKRAVKLLKNGHVDHLKFRYPLS